MKQHAKIVRDLPAIKLIGRQLGPWAAGEEAELWAWEATVLERHGIAIPGQKPTLVELRKLILADERSPELVSLPEDFYLSVVRHVSALRAGGDFEKADEVKSQTLALVEIRLPKLIRLALSPEAPTGLPLEENFLINRLAQAIENWSQRLGESFEAIGEEVKKNELGGPVGGEADIQKPRVSAAELHARGTATPK